MEMMSCPHCGAQNSAKRDYCYQCQGDLHGQGQKEGNRDYVPTCATCAHAAVFAPLGKQLAADQVWCSKRDEAVRSSQIAGDCFEEAFGWKREDILD
ncbi:MAG: hypothetical protein JSV79_09185 [Armatimonadota bacterium]|nr:MAG: hypothetical protein JSV79_09185 [Armatimonadota bacterium]